ncbi:hypothetical protein ACFOY8_14955 [Thalassospira xianhensis]|uniref:Uncharacterized protein n=1 Tax=Thalassospira xianhensis MCCC 1A02616 TaxID=1177929 RepID=A0A367UGX1_9PROT|nr:hypothetical protein [Thalassospira xianhensis]RCK07555.1 hypothetical protein TH5_00270 [Thalassospira xianhensis MCCC 1A02616]
MIIDVYFHHNVTYTPPRARNEKNMTMRQTILGNFQEFTGDQCKSVGTITKEPNADPVEIFFDGKTCYADTGLTPESLKEVINTDDPHRNPLRDVQQLWWGTTSNGQPTDRLIIAEDVDPKRIGSSDFHEQRAKVLQAIMEFAIIDGKLIKRVGTPVWHHKITFADDGTPVFEIRPLLVTEDWLYKAVEEDDRQAKVMETLVSLLRDGDVEAYYTKLADALNKSKFGRDRAPKKIQRLGSIDISEPEALKIDLETPKLLAAAQRVVQGWGGSIKTSIASTSAEHFAAYAALRDAFTNLKGREITEDLSVAIELAANHYDADGARSLASAHKQWRESVLSEIKPFNSCTNMAP